MSKVSRVNKDGKIIAKISNPNLRLEISNPNDIPQDHEKLAIKEKIRIEKISNPDIIRDLGVRSLDDINKYDANKVSVEIEGQGRNGSYTKFVNVSPQARSLQTSNDLRSNSVKFHGQDDRVQKKLDRQEAVRVIEVNGKFKMTLESYFDGYNFYTQGAGYTLSEIEQQKAISLRLYDGILKGTYQFKSIKDALRYIFNLKGDLKTFNAVIFNTSHPSDVLIGFGKYKPYTKERYLSINKPYNERIKEEENKDLLKHREDLKIRNLAKMLKKD